MLVNVLIPLPALRKLWLESWGGIHGRGKKRHRHRAEKHHEAYTFLLTEQFKWEKRGERMIVEKQLENWSWGKLYVKEDVPDSQT